MLRVSFYSMRAVCAILYRCHGNRIMSETKDDVIDSAVSIL